MLILSRFVGDKYTSASVHRHIRDGECIGIRDKQGTDAVVVDGQFLDPLTVDLLRLEHVDVVDQFIYYPGRELLTMVDFPDFIEGQRFQDVKVTICERFTSPPKPYTEDTLLSAMETAGKEDMPDDAERKGLGTPATRAAIIEKLVAAGFVERKGKSLIPTKDGINLVTVLPEPLTCPMLTAEWEQQLTAIARGEADPDTFTDGICDMVRELVKKYTGISEEGQKLFAPDREIIGCCPRCGKPVYEGKKNFACSDRSCSFVLWKQDRFWTSRKKELTKKMAADLLKRGRTAVKGMWSEKKGDTYDATVVLDDSGGKFVKFKMEFPKERKTAAQ